MSAQALRVGIYGGAFDPPHWAHVAIARAFLAQCRLDELRVLPTGQAWHRNGTSSPAFHRVAMSQLAFGDLPRVVVDDRETRRPGPTFTIDTLEALQVEREQASWFLLMGEDQWAQRERWHRWQELSGKATIVVAERTQATSFDGSNSFISSSHTGLSGPAPVVLQWQPLPLSSSWVRAHLAQGGVHSDSIRQLVPDAVARYISDHQLYTTPKT